MSLVFVLTCEHPMSSYNIPVLVDQEKGTVYGPGDSMPWGESAARFVQRVWVDDEVEDVPDEVTQFLSAAGLPVG